VRAAVRLIRYAYAVLVRLYPRSFRREFEEEMRAVFAQMLAEAAGQGWTAAIAVCLRELREAAGFVFREHWHAIRSRGPGWPGLRASHSLKEVVMTDNNRNREQPASWAATLAAALPLAGFPVLWLLAGTIRRLFYAVHLDSLFHLLWTDALRISVMPMIFYLLLLAGLLTAWLKGFPRWSYPYLGWLLVFLISEMDIWVLDDPYLWRVWVPFLVTLLFAILLRPSREPLHALWRGWRRDWTLSSFAMLGILEFVVCASFDEMPGPRKLWQSLSAAVLVIGALGYMRIPKRTGRVAALLGSAGLSVALNIGANSYYWHGGQLPHMDTPLDGLAMLSQSLVIWTVYFVVLMSPALLSVVLNRLWPARSTQ
jgi:hypothetical protein